MGSPASQGHKLEPQHKPSQTSTEDLAQKHYFNAPRPKTSSERFLPWQLDPPRFIKCQFHEAVCAKLERYVYWSEEDYEEEREERRKKEWREQDDEFMA